MLARSCRCFCDLSKPSQRLQRLIHSISSSSSHGQTAKDLLKHDTTEAGAQQQQLSQLQSEEQLSELRMLVDLLPAHLRESLLSRSDISQVG